MSPGYEPKLAVLRAAAEIGRNDIEAGRSKRFQSARELRDYLDALVMRSEEKEQRYGQAPPGHPRK